MGKVSPIGLGGAKTVRQQPCKEVILWNWLSHLNVPRLVGVLGGMDQYQFSAVSEWMTHGNIMEYIRAASGLKLVSFQAQSFIYGPFLISTIAVWCGARAELSSSGRSYPWESQRGSFLATTRCTRRFPNPPVGKHSHDKRHASQGVSCGIWVYGHDF